MEEALRGNMLSVAMMTYTLAILRNSVLYVSSVSGHR